MKYICDKCNSATDEPASFGDAKVSGLSYRNAPLCQQGHLLAKPLTFGTALLRGFYITVGLAILFGIVEFVTRATAPGVAVIFVVLYFGWILYGVWQIVQGYNLSRRTGPVREIGRDNLGLGTGIIVTWLVGLLVFLACNWFVP